LNDEAYLCVSSDVKQHCGEDIDWLIIYGFTSRSRIFHLYGDVTIAGEGLPMFGAQGLWAGRDLYHATPAVTRDLGFSSLIRRTAPFSRLLRHTRGCGGSILTQILTGEKTLNIEYFSNLCTIYVQVHCHNAYMYIIKNFRNTLCIITVSKVLDYHLCTCLMSDLADARHAVFNKVWGVNRVLTRHF
jgi:hypothetical protein